MYLSRMINDIETELGRKVLEDNKVINMPVLLLCPVQAENGLRYAQGAGRQYTN